MLKAYLVILFFCFTYTLTAQRNLVVGYLKDSTTGQVIPRGKITNNTANDIVYSNPKGIFRIQASEGDLLIISPVGFSPKFITYSKSQSSDTVVINLLPSGKMLSAVVVSAGYNKYQLDSLNRLREFEQFRGGRLSAVSRAEGFGLTFNLDRIFKQRYKFQRKNEKRFKEREKRAYVAHRYSMEMVSAYSGLKDDELIHFMEKHTPSYQWLRKHPSDQEVLLYISEHLKIYRKKND